MNALQTRCGHNGFVGCGETAPEQHDQKEDHPYQAKAPAEVMVWRTGIEATTPKRKIRTTKNKISPIFLLLWKWKARRLQSVDAKADRTNRNLKKLYAVETEELIWVNVSANLAPTAEFRVDLRQELLFGKAEAVTTGMTFDFQLREFAKPEGSPRGLPFL